MAVNDWVSSPEQVCLPRSQDHRKAIPDCHPLPSIQPIRCDISIFSIPAYFFQLFAFIFRHITYQEFFFIQWVGIAKLIPLLLAPVYSLIGNLSLGATKDMPLPSSLPSLDIQNHDLAMLAGSEACCDGHDFVCARDCACMQKRGRKPGVCSIVGTLICPIRIHTENWVRIVLTTVAIVPAV